MRFVFIAMIAATMVGCGSDAGSDDPTFAQTFAVGALANAQSQHDGCALLLKHGWRCSCIKDDAPPDARVTQVALTDAPVKPNGLQNVVQSPEVEAAIQNVFTVAMQEGVKLVLAQGDDTQKLHVVAAAPAVSASVAVTTTIIPAQPSTAANAGNESGFTRFYRYCSTLCRKADDVAYEAVAVVDTDAKLVLHETVIVAESPAVKAALLNALEAAGKLGLQLVVAQGTGGVVIHILATAALTAL